MLLFVVCFVLFDSFSKQIKRDLANWMHHVQLLCGRLQVTPGTYTVQFGVKATLEHGMGYAEVQTVQATVL